MYHLQSNLLVSIDVETTGLDPDEHEIWQIGAMPLDANFQFPGLSFETDIRPSKPENADRALTNLTEEEFTKLMKCPIGHEEAHDLWWEWVDSLREHGYLATGRKIIPLAQNWVFDRSFLVKWLGWESFHDLFHPWARDPMIVAQFLNDANWHRWDKPDNTRAPFEKANLAFLCKKLKVNNTRPHHALSDAAATAEVYRRLVLDRAA